MLYDLVPIPNRYQTDAMVSSVVPVFGDEEKMDEIHWYGWDLDAVAMTSSGFHKYKTVELSGPYVIERMFVTKEPIDLKKRWWTSNQEIYPIYQNMHRGTSLDQIQTVKFLNGITGALQLSGIGICCPRTIHSHILRAVSNSLYWSEQAERFSKNLNHILHKCIFGDDVTNVDVLERVKGMRSDPRYVAELPYICDYIPEHQVDPSTRIFLQEEVTLEALHKIRALDFGCPMCSVISAEIEPPFDPAGENVKYCEAEPDRRWAFLAFVHAMERIEATDYHLKIKLDHNQVVDREYELYNRYKGIASKQSPENDQYHIDELFNSFARWYWHDLTRPPMNTDVVEIDITKNWLDEAYVAIKHNDDLVDQYYIDFTMYAIGSLSVMDQYGS